MSESESGAEGSVLLVSGGSMELWKLSSQGPQGFDLAFQPDAQQLGMVLHTSRTRRCLVLFNELFPFVLHEGAGEMERFWILVTFQPEPF